MKKQKKFIWMLGFLAILTAAGLIGVNVTAASEASDQQASLTGDQGDEDWYRSDKIIVQAPTGYEISVDGETTWQDSYVYEEQGTKEVTYQLKSGSGEITDPETMTLKLDNTMPTAEIIVKDNAILKWLNKITRGNWFKDNVTFSITAEDAVSGVQKVEYQILDEDGSGNWYEYSQGLLTLRENCMINVRVTDKAGNVSVISSD